jgi:hypothetical protein
MHQASQGKARRKRYKGSFRRRDSGTQEDGTARHCKLVTAKHLEDEAPRSRKPLFIYLFVVLCRPTDARTHMYRTPGCMPMVVCKLMNEGKKKCHQKPHRTNKVPQNY